MWTRSGETYSSERARAMKIAASHEYSSLGNDLPQRARFLRSQEFTFAVISWVMKAPLTSVKRWVGNPIATTVRGRRPLLTPQQDQDILDKVLEAAQNHEAMRPSVMREAVSCMRASEMKFTCLSHSEHFYTGTRTRWTCRPPFPLLGTSLGEATCILAEEGCRTPYRPTQGSRLHRIQNRSMV